jgi:hypothetical protein
MTNKDLVYLSQNKQQVLVFQFNELLIEILPPISYFGNMYYDESIFVEGHLNGNTGFDSMNWKKWRKETPLTTDESLFLHEIEVLTLLNVRNHYDEFLVSDILCHHFIYSYSLDSYLNYYEIVYEETDYAERKGIYKEVNTRRAKELAKISSSNSLSVPTGKYNYKLAPYWPDKLHLFISIQKL